LRSDMKGLWSFEAHAARHQPSVTRKGPMKSDAAAHLKARQRIAGKGRPEESVRSDQPCKRICRAKSGPCVRCGRKSVFTRSPSLSCCERVHGYHCAAEFATKPVHSAAKGPDAGDIRAIGEVSERPAYLQTLIFLITTLP
jgi:hypothetical protein